MDIVVLLAHANNFYAMACAGGFIEISLHLPVLNKGIAYANIHACLHRRKSGFLAPAMGKIELFPIKNVFTVTLKVHVSLHVQAVKAFSISAFTATRQAADKIKNSHYGCRLP